MTTENTEKTILENFYSERTPVAPDNTNLLPSNGAKAPKGGKYFMEFSNVEVRKSERNGDWPYVNSLVKVIEPTFFENRGFFTMFWLPPVYPEMDDTEREKAGVMTDNLLYNIDTICGDGVGISLFGEVNDRETAIEAMEKLADLLDEERAVVEVVTRTPNKARQAQGYTDKFNAAKSYANATTWEGEDI